MGKFQKPKEKKQSEQKTQTRKYLRLTMIGILVVLLAVMPMLATRNAEAEASQASILSVTVEEKTIDTQIIGGGQLSSEASLNVRIPENVKLTKYLVGNGDTVKEGDPIATVDKVSVMTAITQVQETLDYLAEEIADVSDDTASTSVKALAGGTVKVIYANEGEAVQDVMLDHGALAVLSLDDTMAVKIEKETNLDVGDTVVVTLPDGTEADGRVKTNLEGVLTITMDDDDYSVGAKVTVATESGDELGTGELYVFSPWSATAYSGTISDVLVAENDTVAIGRVLFTLEDTGNSAQFQRLIDQRQEYEELMQELFTMYRTETITAPCDGIVTGVDEDGAYLLADDGDGWFVSLLSFFDAEKDGFRAYKVAVTEVTNGGMTMRIDPRATYIEDLAAASRLSADIDDMTESWTYQGEIPVYTQEGNGLLRSTGTAKAGDLLLAIGDEEQVHWFVKLDESGNTEQIAQTENNRSGFFAFLLSDTDTPENVCTMDENCTADIHNDGCVKTIIEPAACTGDDSCTAETHNEGCPRNPIHPDACTGMEGCSASTHNEGCPALRVNSEIMTVTKEEPEPPTVQITTTELPSGTVGSGYNATLQASAGGTWTMTGLPDGLTYDTSTGEISGTPVSAGSYSVAATFTYGDNQTVTASFTLTISEASSDLPEEDPVIQITTTTLGTGVVGKAYTYPVQVSGSTSGTWSAANLPSGLVINEQTGVISGTPTYEGTFTVTITYTDTATQTSASQAYTLTIVTAETVVYTGYVAQVVEIKDGWAKVKQTLYGYTIADLSNPPKVSASETDLTVEKEYTSDLFKTSELAVGDTFLIVVNNRGTVKLVSKDAIQESQATGTPGQQGVTNAGGAASSGGGNASGGGMGGTGQVQTFETYSLDKLTVASVTSQEHMTVSITIDELDITRIYVGQPAMVSVDALGGEQFEAEITGISNSGENEGGNSKFTVEVTLGKSGEMLPGMYSSAFITLETRENVPCVPVAALGKDGVDSILYTSYDAETGTLGDPVVVTIGVSDGENVQILEGFAAGETCYYEYFDTYVGSDAPQQQGGNLNLGRMLGGR
ncbi:MAG: putative Ig domain-containing protein [Oscillospiraceae bacterium]|nr:putative Ig domain-containing protein [Oscillospiraceae bacterium]